MIHQQNISILKSYKLFSHTYQKKNTDIVGKKIKFVTVMPKQNPGDLFIMHLFFIVK